MSTSERERMKALEREKKELRRVNEILKSASAFFAQAALDPRIEEINAYIDRHRDVYGVEPICKVLQGCPIGVSA